MRTRTLLAGAATVVVATGMAVPAAVVAAPSPDYSAPAAMTHLQELDRIAAENGGNRAVGTPGYEAALDYVQQQLDQAGFVTTRQEFTYGGTTTWNLLAETEGGNADNTVVVGAHLDGVESGHGINDNGSGSAAVLNSALQYAESGAEPANKLRFAFWGAEEVGLVGSTHYVDTLSQQERDQIAMYLNYDMVGSNNAGYFTYDGDDSDGVGAGPGPDGSAEIEQALNDALSGAGVEPDGTDFDGRSDYGPFIEVGIPSGGIFTGAEGRMTQEQAQKWNGRAGEPYDACYHQACDDLDNLNNEAFEKNSQVISSTVADFAAQLPIPQS
ncbi:M20/M25/M40 family metallo-hydrolase [Allosaccharopolyspora coralli]|uniref:M20/M25/M40 family metallo-hydrolase n=1 Tax=Allosaccharopolyspora coralli TaxID=2665642 RepID=A0A5Q3QGA3_9PSEU|nr:M28 family metallopeptidase [Allosaccharopolyspora coralli]QGK70565.1 M20/M25/M40 family metallo-hydrolase [Allosaccharopolyspora coralli]